MSQTGLWNTGAPADPVAYGQRLLDIAVRRHRPVAVFGLFSGGHDSLCATHLASCHPAFTAAVHINTGIGIEETREFVRDTCRARGWPLIEGRAVDEGFRYEDLVLQYGFPGPYGHGMMYTRLKERALRTVVRKHKRHHVDRVLLVGGMRLAESRRRMGNAQPLHRQGAMVWCSPIIWFGGRHKNAYMEEYGLPRNPVVDHLHMSGECLCGAFAKPGELDWIEYCGYTDVVERIRDLEARAKARGVPCRWGERPPPPGLEAPGFMCVGCAE